MESITMESICMRKICIVATEAITIRSFLIGQMKFLANHGYDITVICNEDNDLQKHLPAQITYRPIKMKRGIDGLGALKSIYELYRLFKKGDFDMVQYSTPNAAMYASIASTLANVPIRIYCQWGIRYVGFSGWRRFVFKKIEKLVCTLSTVIQPDSKGNLIFSYNEGLYNSDKGRVIWNGSANGVDLSKFDIKKKNEWRFMIRAKYELSEHHFVIGFIGRIYKDKGINELLQAFKILTEKYDHIRLFIIGPLDVEEGVNEQLLTWSYDAREVVYCGYSTQVEAYLAACDIFVLPSYREGFGTVVIEAGAMGLPVIVSNIPGPTDAMIEKKTGFVIPKGSVHPLVNAIEKLMLNPVLHKQMGEHAHQYVKENYDQKKLWRYILDDRNALYDSVVFPKKGDER